MEVCHVCGAFLVMNDTSNRLDAHLQGKQHTGYQKIHETYEELKVRKGPMTLLFFLGLMPYEQLWEVYSNTSAMSK